MHFIKSLFLAVTASQGSIGVDRKNAWEERFNNCLRVYTAANAGLCFGTFSLVSPASKFIAGAPISEDGRFERSPNSKFFCLTRALEDTEPGIFGPQEPVVFPKSHAHCQALISVRKANTVSIDLAQERKKSSPELYTHLAHVLRILKKVHGHGLLFDGSWYALPVSFTEGEDGRVLIRSIKSMKRKDGIDLLVSSIKNDLNYLKGVFMFNGYTPLTRNQMDPNAFEFIDAVQSTRLDGEFDYDRWIEFFSRPAVKGTPRIGSWEVNDRMRAYWSNLSTCLDSATRLEQSIGSEAFAEASGEIECPPAAGARLKIDGDTEVRFVERERCNNQGTTGFACPSEDGAFFLKSYSKAFYGMKMPELACNERSILNALNSMGGFIPSMHEIVDDGSLSRACAQVSLVVASAGSTSLHSLFLKAERTEKFQILARLLEIVRELHESGFAHNDLYFNNVFVGDVLNASGSLKLIDFGASKPVCDETGTPLTVESPFRADMLCVADKLKFDPEEYRVFYIEMEALGAYQRPNYAYWIQRFTEKST